MYGACSLYLRSVESYPAQYVAAIADLRAVLGRLVQELGHIDTRLELKMPGEKAFPA
jgi:hypothetical protein